MINKELFEEIQEFNEKYRLLEEDHRAMNEAFSSHMVESQEKWFQITKELVNCSKSLIEMILESNSNVVNHRKFIKIQKRT